MAITDFGKSVNRILARQGNAFVVSEAGYTVSLGVIRDASITTESITSEADTLGRTKTLGINVTVGFTMQQTGQPELSNLGLLAGSETETDPIRRLVLTSQPATAGDVEAAGDKAGMFVFGEPMFDVSINLDFDGETEGTIRVEATGRVGVESLNRFGTLNTDPGGFVAGNTHFIAFDQ
jgi:hypothetical protein